MENAAEVQRTGKRPTALRVFTNSEVKAFRRCKRLHHLAYRLRFRPMKKADPLVFGGATHAWLETWWRAIQRRTSSFDALEAATDTLDRQYELDPYARARARAMLIGYQDRWYGAPVKVVAVEQPFDAPMRRPDGRHINRFRQQGKVDVILELADGRMVGMEHKTTVEDLAPGSVYWRRQRMDSQMSGYVDGLRAVGYPIDGMIYDGLVKIGLRPMKATPVEDRKYTKEKRDKEGNVVEPSRLYAAQREADETPAEYFDRCHAEVAKNIESYFARDEVPILDQDLARWREDTMQHALDIEQAEKTGRHPRNVDGCHMYGRACEYIEVCEGRASLDDPTKFYRTEDIHPELQPTEEG